MKPKILMFLVWCLAWSSSRAQTPSPVLVAMKEELRRSFEALKTQPIPPYYLSYLVVEQQRTLIRSSFGMLDRSTGDHVRQLVIDLRVGDYALDNTHQIRGDGETAGGGYTMISMPIEDDTDALRTVMWLETDKRYKRALEDYMKVKTNVSVKVKEEDVSGDFSREEPETFVESPQVLMIDRTHWEARLKKYSALFRAHPLIFGGQAVLDAVRETKYFVNSEGAFLQTSVPYVRVSISALSKAVDGMELPRYESFFAFSPEGLPSDDDVVQRIQKMIDDLEQLRTAPVVEPYSGPAILQGGAAGVFFHEVLGHRAEGHRQKSEYEGQTFKKKLGELVLPEDLSVVYDPTVQRSGTVDLSGYYKYDDQGVKAQRVAVIEWGVFKRFLMSRSPIESFPHSNGHGRAQAGFQPVARQSNLFIETRSPVPSAKLREMLIDDCRRRNKPYGLLFGEIQGGFTMTGRTMPNAFNVLPLVVYRVYVDGRPDEMVRGVDFVGTPLATIGKVVAAGDDPVTWYGFCGAESGGVPVSQTSPSILLSEVEVQKKEKSQEKPPVLPPPSDSRTN